MTPSELAQRQIARLAAEALRNRERFPFVGEWLDALVAGGITARCVFAENFVTGEKVGKRDPGPWIDGAAWARHIDLHNAWFGRGSGLKRNTEPQAPRAGRGGWWGGVHKRGRLKAAQDVPRASPE